MTPAPRRLLLAALLVTAGVSAGAAAWAQPLQPDALATPVTDRWLAEYAQRVDVPGNGRIVEEKIESARGAGAAPQRPDEPHRLRAALEIGTWLVIYGGFYYTGDRDANHVDWEYDVGSSLRARFVNGDAYRFDDNSFRINRNHAPAGMYYYQFARSNNLGPAESFLFTLAASSIWEYGVEYRELVSINDQIMTPLAGLALGEATHQIALMLASGPRIFPDAVLADLLDIPLAFNRWVDGGPAGGWREPRPVPSWRNREHLDARVTFRSHAGGARGEAPPARFSVEASVLRIPGYDEPGVGRRLLTDTVFSRLAVQVPLNFAPVTYSGFEAENTLAAVHWKDLARTEAGELQGYSLFAGPSNAFTLFNVPEPGGDTYNDYMAVAHILGPALDASWYLRGARVRAAAALYGDFAMVHPFAFAGYRRTVAPPPEGGLMDIKDYYFAYGWTGSALLTVDRGAFAAGAGLIHGSFRALEGRARYPEWDEGALDARDQRTTTEAWVAWRFSGRVALRAAVERVVRDGSVESYQPPAASGTTAALTLSYSLR